MQWRKREVLRLLAQSRIKAEYMPMCAIGRGSVQQCAPVRLLDALQWYGKLPCLSFIVRVSRGLSLYRILLSPSVIDYLRWKSFRYTHVLVHYEPGALMGQTCFHQLCGDTGVRPCRIAAPCGPLSATDQKYVVPCSPTYRVSPPARDSVFREA